MALYMKAAEILDKVEQKKGAVKTLVYDSKFQVIVYVNKVNRTFFLFYVEADMFAFISEY